MKANGKTLHVMAAAETVRVSTKFTTGGSLNTLSVDVDIDFLSRSYTIRHPRTVQPLTSAFTFERQTIGSYSPAIGRLITKAAEIAEQKLSEAKS